MTYLEIYQNVKRLIPPKLREKYDHLSYGEMAEVAELSQWAEGLRWAEAQWEKIALQDEFASAEERMQGNGWTSPPFLRIPARAPMDKGVAHYAQGFEPSSADKRYERNGTKRSEHGVCGG